MENGNNDNATYYQPSFFDTHADFTTVEQANYKPVKMEFLNADFNINNGDGVIENLDEFIFFDKAGRDGLMKKEEEINGKASAKMSV